MDQKQHRLLESRIRLKPLRYERGQQWPVFCEKKPSEEFLKALEAGQGPSSATCNFCQRIFVSVDCDTEFIPKQPYTQQPVSSLCVGYLDNRMFVFDCPCNAATIFEMLFWQHLPVIAPYSQARAQLLLESAQDKVVLANSVVVQE